MILNDDLKMFAAMNGVHGTADHAVWIEAGTARGRDDEIGESFPIAKQARNRHTVRVPAMFLDATSRALIAASAAVQIEDENAPSFVEPLVYVIGQQTFSGP